MPYRSRSRRKRLSQPRRRRRRRRKPGAPSEKSAPPEQNQKQPPAQQQAGASAGRRRRRRGRPRGEGKRPSSPKSSEELVRNGPKKRPATLTAPPDGQTLEAIIGELQSQYGVPQYPQEYRITIKVADERDHRAEQASSDERKQEPAPKGDGPKREKAPAAPVLMREGSAPASSAANKKRRRGRRGRRRRGGSGGSNGSAPAGS